MQFRVLGQLEVWSDGERLALGSMKQRSLLALLLIHANRAVSTDRIIDELWGADGSSDHHNALWVQISKLRSALEPGRPPRSEGSVLLSRPPGYLLVVQPGGLDAERFDALVEDGRRLLGDDPIAASRVLGETLALWRGRPYEEFLYESFAEAETVRLEDRRLEAVELRVEADLRCGLAGELVSELQGLVRQHPLREQLAGQLMLALYRANRQAEALRIYGRLRQQLVEELGIDPSPALQELETRMVRADPGLHLRAGAHRPARVAIRGYELRDRIGTGPLGPTFRGYQAAEAREVTVTVVDPALADDSSFIRRFQTSEPAAAAVHHPHLLAIDDQWREPEGAFLVTRLFEGVCLQDMLRTGPLPTGEAVVIVGDVASALAFLHRRGYAHGAIDPSSVLVDGGRGFLYGFGLAPTGSTVAPEDPRVDSADRFASPELRGGGPITAASDVYALGRVLEEAIAGPAGIELSVDVEAPQSIADLIRRCRAAAPRERFADASAFADALLGAGIAPSDARPLETGPDRNPYKGLQAFGELDAADFFGRERVVERLIARLGSRGAAGRFVAVVGPSGSGKSSAVRAGLLPALRAGALPGSAEWFLVQTTPGQYPFDALAAGLESIAIDPPADLRELLADGPTGLGRGIRACLPDDQAELLLVVDQFEEIFTQATADICRTFLDSLAALIVNLRNRVRVIVTLRADFYDRPLAHHAFGEVLRRGTEPITAMSPEDLELAIVGPADVVGVGFERGLVAQIVADVADHVAALPLLQYALTELFDHRAGKPLALSTYLDLGGAAGALARRAEDMYEDFDHLARARTRQILLRLVEIGDGEEDITRRRVLRSELSGLGDEGVDDVLRGLAEHRLVAFDRDAVTRSPTVEISHEALFTEWHRLKRWIAESREDVRAHHRLAAAAEDWRRAGKVDDDLLRGARLDELAAVAARSGLVLTPPERQFLDASVDHRDAEKAAQRDRQRHEARTRRRSRRRTAMLVTSAVALLAVSVVAGREVARRRANDREAAAVDDARRLAAAASSEAATSPDGAMLLSLQSLAVSADHHQPAVPEAEDSLQWAVQDAGLTYPLRESPVAVRAGPAGPTGIFQVPLPLLVNMARKHLKDGFNASRCRRYHLSPCPSRDHGLATPSATGPAPVPTATAVSSIAPASKPLAGTTVTLQATAWDNEGLTAELQAFQDRTGIAVNVVHAGAGVFDTLPDGGRPDVMLSFAPYLLHELAAQGRLVDLTTFLEPVTIRKAVGDELTDQATIDGGIYSIPIQFTLNNLVWYSARAFRAAGYAVPNSWDGLMALSERMIADRRTPWCFGGGTGPSAGWPLTDLLEGLVLRVGGPAVYDHWVSHDLHFDSDVVRRAGRLLGDALLTAGAVQGGPVGAAHSDISFAVHPMFDDPPGCLMMVLDSGLLAAFPTSAHLGEDIDYFVLPPVDGPAPAPVLGGGVSAAAMSDRPEVRALMGFFAGKQWGATGASQARNPFIPPRVDLQVGTCVNSGETLAANALRVRLCQDARDALANGAWRFDGSVQMPTAIGDVDSSGRAGAFEQGMLDYLSEGPSSLEQVLQGIDDAWPN